MIELGLTESEVSRKTLEYLMGVQGEDGSWDENRAIIQYNPPFWNMPGDLKNEDVADREHRELFDPAWLQRI